MTPKLSVQRATAKGDFYPPAPNEAHEFKNEMLAKVQRLYDAEESARIGNVGAEKASRLATRQEAQYSGGEAAMSNLEILESMLEREPEPAVIVEEAISTPDVNLTPARATVAANGGFYTPPRARNAVAALLKDDSSPPNAVPAPTLPSSKSRG